MWRGAAPVATITARACMTAGRGRQREGAVRVALDPFDPFIGDPGAEFLRLLLHAHHQLGAHDAFGEAREVLDFGGGGQLPARLRAGQQRAATGSPARCKSRRCIPRNRCR